MKLTRRELGVGAAGLVATSAARTTRAASEKMPTGYVGHGSPRLLVDVERGAELARWSASFAPPRGIVVLTPHVRSRRLEIGHVGRGHGLYSFPRRFAATLPQVDYASPPNDALAARVRALLAPLGEVAFGNRGGFDHTSWMPLRHMFPRADAPVVELALPFGGEREMFALGRALAPLRDEGVFVLASGNVTHNLAMIAPDASGPPRPWAEAFDAWLKKTIEKRDVASLLDWRRAAPSAELAHPDDGGHYRVMLVALGVAVGGSDTFDAARFPSEGFEMGSQSKRCIEMG
jgi:4,5-DOPA dioxygenase extradiol